MSNYFGIKYNGHLFLFKRKLNAIYEHIKFQRRDNARLVEVPYKKAQRLIAGKKAILGD